MNVWVAGASGQIGKTLLKQLYLLKIPHFGTTREQIELTDEDQVSSCMKYATHVVNAAGFSHVEAAESKRNAAYLSNAVAPYVLAKLAKIYGTRFIHISTDYVFDGTNSSPYQEEAKTNPLNWYGQTKREGEERIEETTSHFSILRVSRVFGGPGREYVASALQLMREHRELSFASDQRSRLTYVIDLAQALIFFIKNDLDGIYHYANQGVISKYDFIHYIWQAAKQKNLPLLCTAIHPVLTADLSSSTKRPLSTILNTAKIEQFLPIRSWQEGFSEYIMV